MRSPVRPPPSAPSEALHARLSARIAALEDRVRRLEARLRVESAARLSARPTAARTASAPTPVSSRPRPRCPGCTLELPRGRRGEACVWCGFVFAAVRRRQPSRKKR